MFKYLLYFNEDQSIEIDEPRNVQNVTSRLHRDLNSHGCFFEYTERDLKLGFVCDARVLLEKYYQLQGVSAKVYFEIQFRENPFEEWKPDYYGRINFKTRVYDREYFECSVFSEDIITRMKNNLDVSTDLSATEALTGEVLPYDDKALTVLIHSKTIIHRSEFKMNEGYADNNTLEVLMLFPNNYAIPFQQVVAEVEGTNNPVPGAMGRDIFSHSIWNVGLMGDEVRTIDFNARVKFSIKTNRSSGHHYRVWLASFTLGGGDLEPIEEIKGQTQYGTTFQTEDLSYSGQISLNSNQALFFIVRVGSFSANEDMHTTTINFDHETSFINFTESTKVDDETTASDNISKGYRIKDALNINLGIITGVPNLLKSDFLDNAAHNLTIHAGKKIRGFADAKTIVTTKDINQTLKALYNLGYGVEGEPGAQKVVYEPVDYFYSGEQIMRMEDVTDYSEKPAEGQLINQFIIGYKKYADENGEGLKNTIDDIHTQHEYYLPLDTVKNKLELISPYIASAYLLEEGRRLNYEVTATQRWKHDDDIFLIYIRQVKLKILGVELNFNVAERKEAFDLADNIIDPESMYNLRLSPKHMFLNHYKYINSFVYFHDGETLIQNKKVINNGEATLRFKYDEPYKLGDYQNFDRRQADSEAINRIGGGERTFKPDIVSFKKGLCYEDFQLLRKAHANRLTGIDKTKNYGYITVDTGLGYEVDFFLTDLKYNNITRQAEFEGIMKAGEVTIVPDAPGLLQETLRYNFITTEDGIVIALE